jgi:hypothetical protein
MPVNTNFSEETIFRLWKFSQPSETVETVVNRMMDRLDNIENEFADRIIAAAEKLIEKHYGGVKPATVETVAAEVVDPVSTDVQETVSETVVPVSTDVEPNIPETVPETVVPVSTDVEPNIQETVEEPEVVFQEVFDFSQNKTVQDRIFKWNAAPKLKFTVIKSVVYDHHELMPTPNWTALMKRALIDARNATVSDEDFEQLIEMKFVRGKTTEKGFRYMPELRGSVQNQTATRVWDIVSNIVHKLGINLVISFEWVSDGGSFREGSTGTMIVD